ncbi:MAG: ABC transporter ATP-binding protein [Alphaproteobacteria bacterium]|nr:ABC transporter ATP-binding protein [Alphaproteobacteria bacterium]
MTGLAIAGLTKRYGGARQAAAVDGLDLAIGANRFVTLLGPSGCGKTTTLRLIAGYLMPDAGTIRAGDRILSEPGRVISPEFRNMGMVFQNYAVWPHKTVFENVVFGLTVRRLPTDKARERVERMLDLVHLSGLGGRLPGELSGGQQQRVALARSLVVEPGILLLDEPVSNLDARLRERMRAELKDLQRRTGVTFVYVTHDQAEALALSDEIAVLHGGRLQQVGSPEEVYRRPANRIVADFMGLLSIVPARVLDAAAGEVELEGGGRIGGIGGIAARMGDIVDLGIRPEDVRLRPPDGRGIAAEVVDRVYLGNVADVHLALADGRRLRAQIHPLDPAPVGARVEIEIDVRHLSVFTRDGEGGAP